MYHHYCLCSNSISHKISVFELIKSRILWILSSECYFQHIFHSFLILCWIQNQILRYFNNGNKNNFVFCVQISSKPFKYTFSQRHSEKRKFFRTFNTTHTNWMDLGHSNSYCMKSTLRCHIEWGENELSGKQCFIAKIVKYQSQLVWNGCDFTTHYDKSVD